MTATLTSNMTETRLYYGVEELPFTGKGEHLLPDRVVVKLERGQDQGDEEPYSFLTVVVSGKRILADGATPGKRVAEIRYYGDENGLNEHKGRTYFTPPEWLSELVATALAVR